MSPSFPPVFDGHNDTLVFLHLPERGGDQSFFERSEEGHLDLPRAWEGGFAGGLFATFVPNEEDGETDVQETDDGYEVPLPPAVPTARAKAFTYDVLASLYRLEAQSQGTFRIVRERDDLEASLGEGIVAAVAHLEGGAAVEPDLSNLDLLYAAGVRSIGLVWSRPNAFGHGVPFEYPASPDTGPGLTDAGSDLVRACNERGILVDCAHLNEAGFWDVADITDAPLVVSHAGVHEICPTTRNLTDEQIDAVAQSDGLLGITFAVTQLRPDGENDSATPISTLADHVEYVADRVGIDHVAFGSDFDGATIPDAVSDATGLPKLLAELSERGFDGDDLRKVAHGNWLRVLDETWQG